MRAHPVGIATLLFAMVLPVGDGRCVARDATSPGPEGDAEHSDRPEVVPSAELRPVIREYKGKFDSLGPFVWNDLDGHRWTERDLKGKVVIVALWAAWCGPCIDEFPQLQRLSDLTRDDPSVAFISLNVDRNRGEIEAFLLDFKKEFSFPVLFAGDQLKITALPSAWIVDRDGYIREILRGSGPEWMEQVQALAQKVMTWPPVSELPVELIRKQRAENEREAKRSR